MRPNSERANVTINQPKRDNSTAPNCCNWTLRTNAKCATNRVMHLQNDDSTVHDNRTTSRSEVRMETGQTAYKRKLAYKRLGIAPSDLECAPFFAEQLKRIARCVNRGAHEEPSASRIRPLDYLRLSEDPEARRVVDVYLAVPESYRRLLPPEAFCQAAGVSPLRVLEIIAGMAVRIGTQASTLVAAILHPTVVEKIVERALQNDGTRERMMLHKATGFLPTRG